jgi:hypothetical protein
MVAGLFLRGPPHSRPYYSPSTTVIHRRMPAQFGAGL